MLALLNVHADSSSSRPFKDWFVSNDGPSQALISIKDDFTDAESTKAGDTGKEAVIEEAGTAADVEPLNGHYTKMKPSFWSNYDIKSHK